MEKRKVFVAFTGLVILVLYFVSISQTLFVGRTIKVILFLNDQVKLRKDNKVIYRTDDSVAVEDLGPDTVIMLTRNNEIIKKDKIEKFAFQYRGKTILIDLKQNRAAGF